MHIIDVDTYSCVYICECAPPVVSILVESIVIALDYSCVALDAHNQLFKCL